MRSPFAILRRIRRRFYAGPPDLGSRIRRRKGYQSPTLTALVWLYALALRHLTVPGRILLVSFVFIGPYALTTLAMPANLLAFAIFALMVVDFVAGWLCRPRLSVQRSLPSRVAAGAEATVAYDIQARGRRPAWSLTVDTLPLPHGLSFRRGRCGIRELANGEKFHGLAPIHAARRGGFRISAVRVTSGFPFHLFRFGCTAGHPQTVVVYPEFTRLDRINFPAGVRHHAEGNPQSSSAGNSLEFLGCRDFREGDNLRNLHMRSWARRGAPVVKEFREEYFCRVGVVLDTVLNRHPFEEMRRYFSPRPEFEAMVSLVASVADWLSARDYAVDLFAAGNRIYRFGGSRHLSVADRMLEILACLDYTVEDSFHNLEAQLLSEPPEMGGAVFVMNEWNKLRRELIEELIERGIPCKVVLVRFRYQIAKLDGLPEYVCPLPAEDIAAGQCREI